jgi:hypothetical protein
VGFGNRSEDSDVDFNRLKPSGTSEGQDSAESMLYDMVMAIQIAKNPFTKEDVDEKDVDPSTIAAVRQRLQVLSVDYQLCDVDITKIQYKYFGGTDTVLYFFGVELHSRNFLGGYVVTKGVILTQLENF